MASIIKVQDIQNSSGANIINESSNTITIGASGDNIVIPSGATITNNGTSVGLGGENTPAFKVYQSTSQTSLSFNTYHTLQFDTVDFDTASAYNTGTYKYVVPETGKYFLNFQYGVESVSGSQILTVMAEIYNGTTGYILSRRRTVSNGDHSSTNQPLVDTISNTCSLSASDELYCRVYVFASSGSLKTNANANQEWSCFSGFKLIGA